MLAPFCKKPVRAVLTGVTNSPVDFSVDTFRNVTLPTVQHFGVTEGLSLVIKRRGAAPKGGGMVIFSCPVVRELRPIHITMEGYVKRVRGIAFVTKLSPQIGNRAVESARCVPNEWESGLRRDEMRRSSDGPRSCHTCATHQGGFWDDERTAGRG